MKLNINNKGSVLGEPIVNTQKLPYSEMMCNKPNIMLITQKYLGLPIIPPSNMKSKPIIANGTITNHNIPAPIVGNLLGV